MDCEFLYLLFVFLDSYAPSVCRAWPFGLVEAVWAVVAARRWWIELRAVSNSR